MKRVLLLLQALQLLQQVVNSDPTHCVSLSVTRSPYATSETEDQWRLTERKTGLTLLQLQEQTVSSNSSVTGISVDFSTSEQQDVNITLCSRQEDVFELNLTAINTNLAEDMPRATRFQLFLGTFRAFYFYKPNVNYDSISFQLSMQNGSLTAEFLQQETDGVAEYINQTADLSTVSRYTSQFYISTSKAFLRHYFPTNWSITDSAGVVIDSGTADPESGKALDVYYSNINHLLSPTVTIEVFNMEQIFVDDGSDFWTINYLDLLTPRFQSANTNFYSESVTYTVNVENQEINLLSNEIDKNIPTPAFVDKMAGPTCHQLWLYVTPPDNAFISGSLSCDLAAENTNQECAAEGKLFKATSFSDSYSRILIHELCNVPENGVSKYRFNLTVNGTISSKYAWGLYFNQVWIAINRTSPLAGSQLLISETREIQFMVINGTVPLLVSDSLVSSSPPSIPKEDSSGDLSFATKIALSVVIPAIVITGFAVFMLIRKQKRKEGSLDEDSGEKDLDHDDITLFDDTLEDLDAKFKTRKLWPTRKQKDESKFNLAGRTLRKFGNRPLNSHDYSPILAEPVSVQAIPVQQETKSA